MADHRKEAGQRMLKLREQRGLSQEELAQRAGLSVKTVSRFQNGRHDGRRSTVEKLAKALDVPVEDLWGVPPAALGLGESQLDRIEAKLDAILTILHPDAAEEAANGIDPKREAKRQAVEAAQRAGHRRTQQP